MQIFGFQHSKLHTHQLFHLRNKKKYWRSSGLMNKWSIPVQQMNDRARTGGFQFAFFAQKVWIIPDASTDQWVWCRDIQWNTDFLKRFYFSVLSTYLWGPDPGKPEKPKISAGYGSFFEKRFLPIYPMGEVIFKSLIAHSNRLEKLYNFVEQTIFRKCQ